MRLFRSLLLSFLLMSWCWSGVIAQPEAIRKIAAETSGADLKKNLYALASDKMEGRMMASHGDTLASLLVADVYKKNQLQAPYDGGRNYFQAITAYRKKLVKAEFSIAGKAYPQFDGWGSARNDEADLKGIPVVFGGYGISDSAYDELSGVDIRGKAVLILITPPSNSELLGRMGRSNRNIVFARLIKKGAAAVLYCDPNFKETGERIRKRSFLPVYIEPGNKGRAAAPPIIPLSEERVNELLSPENTTIKELEASINKSGQPHFIACKNRVTVEIHFEQVEVHAPNVIGILPGTDTTAGCVIISAHHDHDGRNGDVIYYGAVDNASGTVAILEVSRLMHLAVTKGLRPKRTIVFASFTGEERGELGSGYYAEHPVYPMQKTWGIINIDMMGRVDTFYSGRRADSSYAYILVEDSLNRGFRTALYNANESSVHLKLDTYYEQPQYKQRRLTGSDQYPFYLKGVPFVRIDCGFCQDYHQPTDTPDKINYELLSKQTELAFLTLWNMANN